MTLVGRTTHNSVIGRGPLDVVNVDELGCDGVLQVAPQRDGHLGVLVHRQVERVPVDLQFSRVVQVIALILEPNQRRRGVRSL